MESRLKTTVNNGRGQRPSANPVGSRFSRVSALVKNRAAAFIAITATVVATSLPAMAQPVPLIESATPLKLAPARKVVNPRLGGPRAEDRRIALAISALMPEYHISGQKLDDTISQRALGLFLNSLDPMKLYFYQSDVDELSRNSNRIDDLVRAGDVKLAYQIFDRFIQRVDERVVVAQELLDGDFDFTIDETVVIDPEAATYAKNAEESRDRWRRQIKFAMLDLKDDETEPEEALTQLRRRYDRYARRWSDMDGDTLLELYLNSVTSAFDPHSTYMSPSTMEDFRISMGLNLDGIGAQLREKDGSTVVTSLIPGGAAFNQGQLKADDVIISVGQDGTGEMVDIVEMPLRDVVKLIRGRAGSVVRLGVKPGGSGSMEIYNVTRARIELEQSAARGEVIEHKVPGSEKTIKIGYINLPSFYLDMDAVRRNEKDFRSSTQDVRAIIDDFKTKGVSGVVMDLSSNGGGSLTEAISLTGLFINRGPVVQVNSPGGQVQKYNDDVSGTSWDGPLVVMTSKFSASASEIFAGAIKDYGRGIIVGDPETHGKGSVQTLVNISEAIFGNTREKLGTLKVTIQKYFLPDGVSTQVNGVKADVVLPSITAKMDVAESDLKYPLSQGRVNAAKHVNYSMVPRDLLNQLQTSSMARVEKDEEFGELLRRIELYVDQKSRDTVSLNETAFMKRRAELNAQKEEEEQEVERDMTDEVIFRDTYYNLEVLNVSAEYILGLQRQNLALLN